MNVIILDFQKHDDRRGQGAANVVFARWFRYDWFVPFLSPFSKLSFFGKVE